MPTAGQRPSPAEFEALLARRRRLGQDRFDEVWEGVLHINPAPSYEHQRLSQRLAVNLDPLASAAGLEAVVGGVNIGDPGDYRIPDGSLRRPGSGGTYLPSASSWWRSSPRMTTPGRSSLSTPFATWKSC